MEFFKNTGKMTTRHLGHFAEAIVVQFKIFFVLFVVSTYEQLIANAETWQLWDYVRSQGMMEIFCLCLYVCASSFLFDYQA